MVQWRGSHWQHYVLERELGEELGKAALVFLYSVGAPEHDQACSFIDSEGALILLTVCAGLSLIYRYVEAALVGIIGWLVCFLFYDGMAFIFVTTINAVVLSPVFPVILAPR